MLKGVLITRRKISIILIALFVVNFVLFNYFLPQVQAAELTEASMRLDRTDVNHLATTTDYILVVAKPTTTATEASLQVTFAAGFTVDGTPANVTISTASLPSTYQGEALSAWPGVGSAATAVASQVVTIASSDLTPGTLYGFKITGGITNPGSAGEKINTITTRTSAPATIDTKNIAVDIVANDTDLVTVNADVNATFNFALSANSIELGDLSTSAVTSGNITIDVDTNANSGWVAFTKSTNQGLLSATTSDEIDSQGTVNDAPTDFAAGTEFYQLDITVSNGTGGGTPSVDAEYDGDADTGGTFSSTYEEIAISTGVGDSDGITYTVLAAASTINEAADDYTDTLYVVGAGNF